MMKLHFCHFLFTSLKVHLCLFRYFDDEDESFEGAYQPAPGSPGPQRKESSDSDEDPLDAFMAGIEQEVRQCVPVHPLRLFVYIYLFISPFMYGLIYSFIYFFCCPVLYQVFC